MTISRGGRSPAGAPSTSLRSGILLAIVLLTTAACQRNTESYFPLQSGWQWQYALRIVTADGSKRAKHLVVNLDEFDLDNQRTVPRRMSSGATYLYVEDADGVRRIGESMVGGEVKVYRSPQTVLRYPLREGSSWIADTRTSVLEVTSHAAGALYRLDTDVPVRYTVASTNDTVSVPAGTFTQCVRVTGEGHTLAEVRKQVGLAQISVMSIEWYAPGVGLIKAVRRETTSSSALPVGEYDMELEALRRR